MCEAISCNSIAVALLASWLLTAWRLVGTTTSTTNLMTYPAWCIRSARQNTISKAHQPYIWSDETMVSMQSFSFVSSYYGHVEISTYDINNFLYLNSKVGPASWTAKPAECNVDASNYIRVKLWHCVHHTYSNFNGGCMTVEVHLNRHNQLRLLI